jgi:hypothetical protein
MTTFCAKDTIDRIKYILRTDSLKVVAEALGKASSSAMTNWIRRNSIEIESIYQFCMDHDISIHWLITGEGPMSAWGLKQTIPESLLKKYVEITGLLAAFQLGDLRLIQGMAAKVAIRLEKDIEADKDNGGDA